VAQPARTVLVADDEALLRRLLGRVLQAHGFAVREAATASEALERLASGDVDVVVYDVLLAGHAHHQALRSLFARRAGAGIVLTSGLAPDSEVRALLGAHRARFLSKPFDPSELVRVVEAALPDRSLANP
jgi:DNA-binding NtrC family response regulator